MRPEDARILYEQDQLFKRLGEPPQSRLAALENARNHKRNVEFARLQQDLDAARQIQCSLLPQRLPAIAGYSIGFRSNTCYEVGGDYLDIVEQPDGSLRLTPFNPKHARTMEIAREVMHEYRDTFAALAK